VAEARDVSQKNEVEAKEKKNIPHIYIEVGRRVAIEIPYASFTSISSSDVSATTLTGRSLRSRNSSNMWTDDAHSSSGSPNLRRSSAFVHALLN